MSGPSSSNDDVPPPPHHFWRGEEETLQVVLALTHNLDEVLRCAHTEHWKPCLWDLTKARQRGKASVGDSLGASNVRHDLEARVRLLERPPEAVVVTEGGSGGDLPDLVADSRDSDCDAEDDASPLTGSTPKKKAMEAWSTEEVPYYRLVDVALLEQQRAVAATAAVAAAATTTAESQSSDGAGGDPATGANTQEAPTTETTTSTDGLRRRRGGGGAGTVTSTSTTTQEWTVEDDNSSTVGSAAAPPSTRTTDTVPTPPPTTVPIDPIELFGGGMVPRELRSAQEHARAALEAYVHAANIRRQLHTHLLQLETTTRSLSSST